jgi:hypothetical protein
MKPTTCRMLRSLMVAALALLTLKFGVNLFRRI